MILKSLLRAQAARFTALDPLLPEPADPPEGVVLTAALAGGERVAGVVVRTIHQPGAPQTLWSTRDVRELHPIVGAAGATGIDALLKRWVQRLDPAGPDSACLVTWPTRDAESTAPLLAHGFVPLTVLAVRTTPQPVSPAVCSVRRATPADLDALVELSMAEVEYAALVGGGIVRDDAWEIKRGTVAQHLTRGDPIWLAELDGVPVGMVEAWETDAQPGSWARTRVRAGRWVFVNCLSVSPAARGLGVGRTLMDVVHTSLLGPRSAGSFLYYNPPNPLSPTFWAKQGYRPLWTVWELRPASALR
ncbi:GNAT family N-acetyltransferase [Actinokineospora soli]|uniref:GNAT family N-acetyltransferase n=1 Tax=Actinokineospora soli TaxID=1048753 RepID=A0ABW2TQU1_9PSEU